MKSLSVRPFTLWVQMVTSTRPQATSRSGVMPFGLGDPADPIREVERAGEVREHEGAGDSAVFGVAPTLHLAQIVFHPGGIHRGHPASAGNAGSAGQFAHGGIMAVPPRSPGQACRPSLSPRLVAGRGEQRHPESRTIRRGSRFAGMRLSLRRNAAIDSPECGYRFACRPKSASDTRLQFPSGGWPPPVTYWHRAV